jgi:hypothetical protein
VSLIADAFNPADKLLEEFTLLDDDARAPPSLRDGGVAPDIADVARGAVAARVTIENRREPWKCVLC